MTMILTWFLSPLLQELSPGKSSAMRPLYFSVRPRPSPVHVGTAKLADYFDPVISHPVHRLKHYAEVPMGLVGGKGDFKANLQHEVTLDFRTLKRRQVSILGVVQDRTAHRAKDGDPGVRRGNRGWRRLGVNLRESPGHHGTPLPHSKILLCSLTWMLIVGEERNAVPAGIRTQVHSPLELSVDVQPAAVASNYHLQQVAGPRLSVYVGRLLRVPAECLGFTQPVEVFPLTIAVYADPILVTPTLVLKQKTVFPIQDLGGVWIDEGGLNQDVASSIGPVHDFQ